MDFPKIGLFARWQSLSPLRFEDSAFYLKLECIHSHWRHAGEASGLPLLQAMHAHHLAKVIFIDDQWSAVARLSLPHMFVFFCLALFFFISTSRTVIASLGKGCSTVFIGQQPKNFVTSVC